MKRHTAEKNLKTVIQRLHKINGVLATPLHNWDAVRTKRAWLFGSFAKGKDEPNDLDIFVEVIACRRDYRDYIGLNNRLRGCYKLDKAYRRSYGMVRAIRSDEAFVKWVRKDMKKVSIHIVGNDVCFDHLDKKILIYPRCDFKFKLNLN